MANPHAVHEVRGAAPARARRRGRGRLVRAATSARTRSSGVRPPSSTTSTTRSTPLSTSTRRTALRSCARRAIPEELIEAVLSHAEHLSMERDTKLKKTLFACDELAGFVHACGLVRPDGIDDARAEVGAEEAEAAVLRGRSPPRRGLQRRRGARRRARRPHPNVVAAMRPIAAELGLRTSEAA